MTVNKLYTSLPANHITAKQTNHVQQTRLYNIIDWQLLSTWLWRWLPHRLSKRQSPTTVLFRTTLTRTITLYELVSAELEMVMNSAYFFIPLQKLWEKSGHRLVENPWKRAENTMALNGQKLNWSRACVDKRPLCSTNHSGAYPP